MEGKEVSGVALSRTCLNLARCNTVLVARGPSVISPCILRNVQRLGAVDEHQERRQD